LPVFHLEKCGIDESQVEDFAEDVSLHILCYNFEIVARSLGTFSSFPIGDSQNRESPIVKLENVMSIIVVQIVEHNGNEQSSHVIVSFPISRESRSYMSIAVVAYGIDEVSGDVIVMANV
jgi:hypothetical protein